MSDDEEYSDEEEVKEPERKPAAHDSHHEAQGTDILKNRQDQKRAELDEMLKEEEEERLRREIEEKKQKEMEEKRRRLAEVEQKRQAADKASKDKAISPNFKVGSKKEAPAGSGTGMDKFSNVESARNDLLKSKEQLEEEKNISLSFRIK